MQVILSANIPHYYHSALALAERGWLARYICGYGARGAARWQRALPPYWQAKIRSRDISGIDPALVRSIWPAEFIQKGLIRLKIGSVERANWLNNHLYDRLARRHVTACDIFHFVSSVGLYSARRARQAGALIICDERTEHPDFQRAILREEHARLGLPPALPGVLYDDKVKQEYAIADFLIVPSRYARQTFVAAGFDPDRIFVVPYGVDVDRSTPPTPAPGPEDDTFRIIFVGQVVPRKGLHYLIEAFESAEIPHAELLVVGRVDAGMRPFVDAAARRLPNLRVLGNVPQATLQALYRQSSVFVLPTLADSWGLVTAEAMAAGLPVIVTEHAGSGEMVRPGVDGFVVPIRDAAAIGHHLTTLAAQPDLRRRMGQAAAEQARSFDWERYKAQLLTVYEAAAARRAVLNAA